MTSLLLPFFPFPFLPLPPPDRSRHLSCHCRPPLRGERERYSPPSFFCSGQRTHSSWCQEESLLDNSILSCFFQGCMQRVTFIQYPNHLFTHLMLIGQDQGECRRWHHVALFIFRLEAMHLIPDDVVYKLLEVVRPASCSACLWGYFNFASKYECITTSILWRYSSGEGGSAVAS